MSRIVHGLFVGSVLPILCSGCAHFVEARAIEAFTTALHNQDMGDLKAHASPVFERVVLRRDEALGDLEILNLPEGEVTIVEVEKVSDTEKRVVAEVGKQKRKLLYKLTREPDSDKWVVNDVVVKQRRKGLQVSKSVTEQMDLLLSVRDVLDAWENGGREEVLSATTPELRRFLRDLPPTYLARLLEWATGRPAPGARFDPDAQMDQDVAVVRLPRRDGTLLMTLRFTDGEWKLDDAAFDPDGDAVSVSSMRELAAVMRSAIDFLKAYNNGNKQALSRLTARKFFRSSLAPVDLSLIELPEPGIPPANFEVKRQGNHATFVLPHGSDVVKIGLARPATPQDTHRSPSYRVKEVTIYRGDRSQEIRLSAYLTAHAKVRIFDDALAQNDLSMLRTTSTPDFNRRVWARTDAALLRELPCNGLKTNSPEVLQTRFRGSLTEVDVRKGAHRFQFLLRNWDGEVRVDDVEIADGHPRSLKRRLELLIPIYEVAAGLHLEQIDRLQRHSSEDFNRLVWRQTDEVPEIGFPLLRHLTAPLTDVVSRNQSRIEVRLGDERSGARVTLTSEHGHYVVDEALLIAGPQPGERIRMKQAMRRRLAEAMRNRQYGGRSTSASRQASGSARSSNGPARSRTVSGPRGDRAASDFVEAFPPLNVREPLQH